MNYLEFKLNLAIVIGINNYQGGIPVLFSEMNAHLLPHNRQNFKTKCSCPEYLGCINFLRFLRSSLSTTNITEAIDQYPVCCQLPPTNHLWLVSGRAED
jgi:hypothetical protein